MFSKDIFVKLPKNTDFNVSHVQIFGSEANENRTPFPYRLNGLHLTAISFFM
jgi:hypothetical protein